MQIAVLGVGKMGSALAYDLCRAESVSRVTLVDISPTRLDEAQQNLPPAKVSRAVCDLKDIAAVSRILQGHQVVVSAADYSLHEGITRAAIQAGCHFCDLGGNIHVVARQLALSPEAERAGICAIPDCGLAPGMANLLTMWGFSRFSKVDSVKIRVGGLPAHPKPPLFYKLVFSVRGLTNEYLEPAEVLRDGKITRIPSLTEWETVDFGAPLGKLEAFSTSGGASTLPQTLQGRVSHLDYKTLRYPGHVAIMKALSDLGFFSEEPITVAGASLTPREVSEAILEKSLVDDDTDVVAVWIQIQGERDGKPSTWTARIFDEADPKTGHSAMMRTTAYPTSIVAQLLGEGAITARGVIPAERCVPLERFVAELAPRGIKVEESWTE